MKLKFTLLTAFMASASLGVFAAPAAPAPFAVNADNAVVKGKPHAPRGNVATRAGVTVGDTPLTSVFGEQESFTMYGDSRYPNGNYVYVSPCNGKATHIKFGYNGDAYIFDPFSMYSTYTYMVGYTEGDGQYPDIICPMPQPILDFNSGASITRYYVDRAETKRNEDTSFDVLFDDEKNDVRYTWKDDHYEMVNDSDNGYTTAIVMTTYDYAEHDFRFAGYSEASTKFYPQHDKNKVPPTTLGTDTWSFTSGNNDEGARNGFPVNVGIDGNNLWIQGIGDNILAESWIKGEIVKEDDKEYVVFKSKQFLGQNGNYNIYFMTTELVRGADPAYPDLYGWVLCDQLKFSFDRENQYIESNDMYEGFAINYGNLSYVPVSIYQGPEIFVDTELTDYTPHDPQIYKTATFQPGMNNPTIGYMFYLFRTNNNGQVLNSNNLAYKIFFDDEQWYFYPDEYSMIGANILSDLKYFYTDGYDIAIDKVDPTMRAIYFYGYDMGDFGVMEYYDNKDEGKRYYSNIVYASGKKVPYLGPDSVEEIKAEGNVVAVEYYDLSGRRVSDSAEGVVIRRSTLDNGDVKVEKIIKK